MKKRVLVFPGGSEIGLEILRSLRFSKDFEVIGASSVDDFSRFAYERYVPNLPLVDEEGFIDAINDVVENYNVDYIFPAHDSVVVELARNQAKIKAEVVTSVSQTCDICRSKAKTYQKLEGVVPTPKMYDSLADPGITYPVFMKPDVGQGSKGVMLATNKDEAAVGLAKDKSLLILENLPGKEYTVDCFTSSDGVLRFSQARERLRVAEGISIESRPVTSVECKEMAAAINKELSFRGVWFFQVKESNSGTLTLMEVAPRVAGTMALCRMQGVNLPLLSLYDRLGIPTNILQNTFDIEISRSLTARYKIAAEFKRIYVDFDDAIIVNDKVNHELIALLYNFANQGKEIHMITKHAKDIKQTLRTFRIAESLFDEIICITKEQEKIHFMQEDSIFIDDSFSERRKVHEKFGIPVFDVSEAVELL